MSQKLKFNKTNQDSNHSPMIKMTELLCTYDSNSWCLANITDIKSRRTIKLNYCVLKIKYSMKKVYILNSVRDEWLFCTESTKELIYYTRKSLKGKGWKVKNFKFISFWIIFFFVHYIHKYIFWFMPIMVINIREVFWV